VQGSFSDETSLVNSVVAFRHHSVLPLCAVLMLAHMGIAPASGAAVEAAQSDIPVAQGPAPEAGSDMEDLDAFEDEFQDSDAPEVFDPLSGYNRGMTHFNDKFYDWLAKPIAKGYQFVLPLPVRSGIGRFFKNLFFPLRFINNLLQLKFQNAAEETARFTVNSTVGLLGFFDPARHWMGLEPHPEDFGQTLGYYGVGSGFHIVLPFLGPSNLRDFVGLVPDYYASPLVYLPEEGERYAAESARRLNILSLELGQYEILRKDSLDLYILLRNAYEENRRMKIEE